MALAHYSAWVYMFRLIAQKRGLFHFETFNKERKFKTKSICKKKLYDL